MGLMNGLLGNMTEMSVESLTQEYNSYLMTNEEIEMGFKLVRDIVLITNHRIIWFDKQGATGKKMRVDSMNLNSIIHVSAETAGFGADDSEINITYITSPFFKASGGITTAQKKYEFPKKYNIQPLYIKLQEIAFNNLNRINA